MVYSRFLSFLSLCLTVLFSLSACAARSFVPRPVVSGIELPSGEAAALFRQLRLKDWEIFNLRSLWRVILTHAGERTALRYAMVYQRPDCLRLEVLPPGIAQSLKLVVAKGGKAILLDIPEKTAYRGYSVEELLKKVFKVPLAEAGLASLLLARIPQHPLGPSDNNNWRAFYDETAESYTVFNQGRGEYYWLDKTDLLLRRVEMRNMFNDELVLRVGYDDFFLSADVALPEKVFVQLPQEKLAVELGLVSINLNQKIADEMFEIEIPPHYRIKSK